MISLTVDALRLISFRMNRKDYVIILSKTIKREMTAYLILFS